MFPGHNIRLGLSQSLSVCLYMSRRSTGSLNCRLPADGESCGMWSHPALPAFLPGFSYGRHRQLEQYLIRGQARAVELACPHDTCFLACLMLYRILFTNFTSFHYMHKCLLVCMSVHHMHARYPPRPEQGVRSLGTRVIGGCEVPRGC